VRSSVFRNSVSSLSNTSPPVSIKTIAADVIDLDTLASGEQRSGLFFAVWGMTTKLALALGTMLGTALPAAFGDDPSAEAVTPSIQARLMAIYGGVSAADGDRGALPPRLPGHTRARHAAVRAELRRRIRA